MKFTASSKQLHACAAAVSRIINAKNTLSILNNFKLELEGTRLTITASDGENFLSGRIEVATAESDGVACIDAKRLVDLLKDLPDVGVEVEILPENNFSFSLKYTNGEFNFSGLDGVEFPSASKSDPEARLMSFEAPTEKLIRAIDNTLFAVGSDELRPQMMGILWDIKPDAAVFVATDTRKLVKFVDNSLQAGAEGRFIAPLKSMVVFRNVFAKSETVAVAVEDKGVTFESAEFTFVSRFVKGNFPDYDRVIPRNNPFTLTVDRQSFLSSVRRIGAFCDAANGLVRFKIDPDRITFKASESQNNSSAWESTACDFTGTSLVIGFSAPYVAEILSTLGSTEVLVQLADPSRPGVFLPSENEPDTELVMLLMPMLVADF